MLLFLAFAHKSPRRIVRYELSCFARIMGHLAVGAYVRGAEHGLSRTFLSVARHRRRSNGAHGFREFDWTEA